MSARGGFWRRCGRVVALVLVVVVVVLAGTIFVTSRTVDEVDPRAGSERLDDAEPGLFDFRDPPETYRIDYRVEGFGSGAVVATSDRLFVRRPFESRLESYDGPVPEGEPSSVQISAFGAVRVEGGAEEIVVASPPAPGVSDVRLIASLEAAHDDGRFELQERRRVAGRECQVIRTAVGLSTADLTPPESSSDYADTCIDAEGLVLEEVLFADGEPLVRRVALDVEVDVEVDDELFEAGEPTLPTRAGGGFIAELVPGSRQPGTFYEPTERPDGFDRRGRFVVVPAQADNFNDETRRGQRLTFVSDVFVDATDLVVLDQGGTLGNVEPFPALRGVEVDRDLGIEGAKEVVLTYGQGGPIVIVRLGDGHFLRARTTAGPDVILDLLASLEAVEGGELELVEEGG